MQQRGFTLIELLVVIAIIGLLSSVVMGSLRMARLRGADASVRAETIQLRNLMALEYADTGSYTNVKAGSNGGWYAAGAACAGATGTYSASVTRVCNALVRATGSACGTSCVWFTTTNPDAPNKFTILAYLPGESANAGSARWFCMGSSGNNSISAGAWTEPGCYSNP